MISALSATAVAIGLVALAAGLYLLQRLRVRHRPVRVVSTLFWREAVEEARARVLVQRFRHPWSYLFLLAILSLLWLSVAGVDTDRRTGERHLVLVDISARAAEGDRFDATLRLVEDTVAALPRARRQVIACGGEAKTLLAPGEPDRLLGSRLADLQPEAAASTLDRVLADHLPALVSAESATVWVVGDAPLSPAIVATVPPEVRIVRRTPERDGNPAPNRGITGLGVSAAESGAWERVDVLVGISGSDAEAAPVSATLDGSPIDDGAVRTVTAAGAQLLFRDLPAAGGRFAVSLSDTDANPLDDAAARILPVRRPLRVALSPELAPWLEPALAADPAVLIVTSGAEVAVRRAGDAVGVGLPALEFVARDAQEESILLSHEADTDSADVLSGALVDLGLDQVDAMELAAAAGRPITLGARPAPIRAIGVWAELLSEEYNFVASRSFPLFVALSVRWLLDVRDFPTELAAGALAPGNGALTVGDLRYDGVGAPVRLPRAGEYLDERGDPIAVSLIDPAGPTAPAAPAPEDAASPDGDETPLTSWFAIVAFALLGAEWFLYRRGELP